MQLSNPFKRTVKAYHGLDKVVVHRGLYPRVVIRMPREDGKVQVLNLTIPETRELVLALQSVIDQQFDGIKTFTRSVLAQPEEV